jgi:nucleoside-diphosphate-sugar epimerase
MRPDSQHDRPAYIYRYVLVHIPYERAYSEGFEDLRRRVPDISKLRRLIGFSPEYPLDATLAKVIRHYRQLAPA